MKKYEVSFSRHTQESVIITVTAADEDSAETIARDKLSELDEKGVAGWEESDQHISCDGAKAVKRRR